jgi:hypothetical protein
MSAPSAWQVQRVVALARETLASLRDDHGQIIDTERDALAALVEEGVDVDTLLRRIIAAALDAKANTAAADDRIDDLKARRDRFRKQEQAYRALAQGTLDALGLTRFQTAEATLSVTQGRPKVIVTDEAKLPDELVTIEVVRTPNKAAILAALLGPNGEYEFSEVISGAELSQAAPILTIRSK